jgi:hypothetical protein
MFYACGVSVCDGGNKKASFWLPAKKAQDLPREVVVVDGSSSSLLALSLKLLALTLATGAARRCEEHPVNCGVVLDEDEVAPYFFLLIFLIPTLP